MLNYTSIFIYCTSAHIHNVLPKMKPYAIALLWLGVQALTEEVHVELEVPPEVDEGIYYVCSPDHCSPSLCLIASLTFDIISVYTV